MTLVILHLSLKLFDGILREINVTVNDDDKHPEFLNKVLLKAATQGYTACHYVFKNLVKYYEKIKEEE